MLMTCGFVVLILFNFGGFMCLLREILLYFTFVTLKKSMTLRKSYISENLSTSPAFGVHLIKKVLLPQTIALALHKYSNGTAIKKPNSIPDDFKWQNLRK